MQLMQLNNEFWYIFEFLLTRGSSPENNREVMRVKNVGVSARMIRRGWMPWAEHRQISGHKNCHQAEIY